MIYEYKSVAVGAPVEISSRATKEGAYGWRLVAIEKDPLNDYGRILILERGKPGVDALDGQAALDEANNRVVDLERIIEARERNWLSKMSTEMSIAMGDKNLYVNYSPEDRWMMLIGHLAGRSQMDGHMTGETREAE